MRSCCGCEALRREKKSLLKQSRDEKLTHLLKDQISNGIRDLSTGKTLIKKSTKLTLKRLNSFDMERFSQEIDWIENKKVWGKVVMIWRSFREEWANIETDLERKIFKLLKNREEDSDFDDFWTKRIAALSAKT